MFCVLTCTSFQKGEVWYMPCSGEIVYMLVYLHLSRRTTSGTSPVAGSRGRGHASAAPPGTPPTAGSHCTH